MDTYGVIKQPRVTEKSTLLKDGFNQISFQVDKRANKIEIRKAVEAIFKAKVLSVQTMNFEGKKRRVGRSAGKRADWKKAIVKLAPGQKIEGLDGI